MRFVGELTGWIMVLAFLLAVGAMFYNVGYWAVMALANNGAIQ